MIREIILGVWFVGIIVFFFSDMYFGWKMLVNLAPGVTLGTAFKNARLSAQRDPAHFNDAGKIYRRRAIKAEWLLLIWAVGGALLHYVVFDRLK